MALHRLPPDVVGTPSHPAPWREETCVKLCFAVEDVAAARLELLAAGGQAKEPWAWEGARYCECADPEGNVLQLVDDRRR